MLAFRIGSPLHPLLDGFGAAMSGTARWSSRGRYVIYAAEHYATSLLEKAAQLNSVKLPRTLMFVEIHLPSSLAVEEVDPAALSGWDDETKAISQSFGDRWYDDRRTPVLLVPSLVAPGLERNVLINQRHPQFSEISASSPAAIRCHPHLLG